MDKCKTRNSPVNKKIIHGCVEIASYCKVMLSVRNESVGQQNKNNDKNK